MTNNEIIQAFLRKKIKIKQHERERNLKLAGDQLSEPRGRPWMQAAARNEKSIALLMSKLMCQHDSVRTTVRGPKGQFIESVRCNLCRTTAYLLS